MAASMRRPRDPEGAMSLIPLQVLLGLAIALFCLLGSIGIVGMQIFATITPERADARLATPRCWIESHQRIAATLLAITIGAWLAIKGGASLF